MSTQEKWATSGRKPTSPHYQGQIYNEETGQTVAISYNDEGGHRANLISAAPELLEALRGCERITKAWLADMKDYPLINPEKAAATMELTRIQAAIAKAEGHH